MLGFRSGPRQVKALDGCITVVFPGVSVTAFLGFNPQFLFEITSIAGVSFRVSCPEMYSGALQWQRFLVSN
ncbi:hypothetical protein [Xylella taiwanensis]|uniref:hypothetical protein n=1 Tax=Xylella taiwanensis TaxID=1444770 RepID=UPI001E422FDE|nr:hypothetical protein [Xylella taiwanensis]MCD8462012.1 hypothetical protein [Xylella taiwanensis]